MIKSTAPLKLNSGHRESKNVCSDIDFLIGGSSEIADSDPYLLQWQWNEINLWTRMVDASCDSASPTVEVSKGSEPCYRRQSWKRSRCSGVVSAVQRQERFLIKSCIHVRLQKLVTAMTHSTWRLMVGTNLKLHQRRTRSRTAWSHWVVKALLAWSSKPLQNQNAPFQLLWKSIRLTESAIGDFT